MKKIMLATILAAYSSIVLADIPVIVLTQGWQGIPIVVNDNYTYFYSQHVCPPRLIILPKDTCGIKR